jgi:predicted dehydrogenase
MTPAEANRPLRIGMLGAGKMALWHLRAYRRVGRSVRVEAIANLSSDRGATLAARFGIPRHFSDGHTLIDEAGVDAIDICVPTAAHRDYLLHAIRKGLHAYCEKPLCGRTAEIREVIAANAAEPRILFNGFNYRFLPAFMRVKRLLAAGEIGEPRHVRIIRTTEDSVDAYRQAQGAGLFNEFHCHFVDLLDFWGFARPRRVHAFGSSLEPPVVNPDTGTMVLDCGGVCAEITTSIVSAGLAPQVLIIGTRGSLRVQFGRVDVVPLTRRRSLAASIALMTREAITLPHRVLRNPFLGSCGHFVECARTGAPTACNERVALQVAQVTEAAQTSFAQGGAALVPAAES